MSDKYEVIVEGRVIKALRKIPAADATRILDAVKALAKDPYPPHCRKLAGRPGMRIRVGVYRILYDVDGDALRVVVFHAGHRGSVYE